MNKEDLIKFVADKASTTKDIANKSINAIVDGISSALEKGDSVNLIGFGSFKVVERAARKGRNPQTGKEIDIPASKAVKFNAGKALKEKVRGKVIEVKAEEEEKKPKTKKK